MDFESEIKFDRTFYTSKSMPFGESWYWNAQVEWGELKATDGNYFAANVNLFIGTSLPLDQIGNLSPDIEDYRLFVPIPASGCKAIKVAPGPDYAGIPFSVSIGGEKGPDGITVVGSFTFEGQLGAEVATRTKGAAAGDGAVWEVDMPDTGNVAQMSSGIETLVVFKCEDRNVTIDQGMVEGHLRPDITVEIDDLGPDSLYTFDELGETVTLNGTTIVEDRILTVSADRCIGVSPTARDRCLPTASLLVRPGDTVLWIADHRALWRWGPDADGVVRQSTASGGRNPCGSGEPFTLGASTHARGTLTLEFRDGSGRVQHIAAASGSFKADEVLRLELRFWDDSAQDNSGEIRVRVVLNRSGDDMTASVVNTWGPVAGEPLPAGCVLVPPPEVATCFVGHWTGDLCFSFELAADGSLVGIYKGRLRTTYRGAGDLQIADYRLEGHLPTIAGTWKDGEGSDHGEFKLNRQAKCEGRLDGTVSLLRAGTEPQRFNVYAFKVDSPDLQSCLR